MIILTFILLITITEAIHEGLYDKGKKKISAIIEFIKFIILVAFILLLMKENTFIKIHSGTESWEFLPYVIVPLILGWTAIRYAIFDPIYNLCAGNELYYIGNVKLYDKFLSKITTKWNPKLLFWWTRPILLIAGISLILNM